MDYLTAGLAVIAVQLCMGLVLGGLWLTDREKSPGAQYWALAEFFLCAGVLTFLLNGARQDKLALVLANNLVIWGGVLQYWGLQVFHGERRSLIAAGIAVAYGVLHLALLTGGHAIAPRVVLYSVAMAALMAMSLTHLLRHAPLATSLASRLMAGALCVVLINHGVRIVVALTINGDMPPAGSSVSSVLLVYLVPLAGTVLYSVGLLLLYFERVIREQRHLARHDSLTGLLNRRALVEAGQQKLTQAWHAGTPLSVALVDIDFFKHINDQLGHEAGDRVLEDMSRLLSGLCRRDDLVGRYGGEEFLLILPGAARAECAVLGERLLQAVRQYRYLGHYPVTASVGFASREGRDSWSALLSRADVQLYRAKQDGRDRYCLENSEAPGNLQRVPLLQDGEARHRASRQKMF